MMGARIRTWINDAYIRWARSRGWRFVRRSWIAQFALIAVVFAALHEAWFGFAKVAEKWYLQPVLAPGALARPAALVLLVAVFALLLLVPRRTGWRGVGKPMRVLCSGVLACSVWGVAFTGYNYFTDQAYLFDRALIVALFALALWRPAFVAPLLVYLLLFLGQGGLSAGDLETTDKFPLFDVQFALVAWLLLRVVLPMRSAALLWFIAALQAVNYFAPGTAKLAIGGEFQPLHWLLQEPLHFYMFKSWQHGWMPWLSRETVEWATGALQSVTPVMRAFTLITELGAMVFVLRRRWAMVGLAAAILLHLGIFSLSGIFFWKWVVLDLLLIAALYRTRPAPSRRARWSRILAMVALLACFPLYAHPKYLGWIDTRVSESYVLEAVTADGVYIVQQAGMSPYDITFEQSDFHYLNEAPVVTLGRGNVRSIEAGDAINGITDAEEMRRYIANHGKVKFHERKAADFDRFVREYFSQANAHAGSKRWLNWLGPPVHIQTRTGDPAWDFATPVQRIRVRFHRVYYDDEHVHVLDDRLIREIEIPAYSGS